MIILRSKAIACVCKGWDIKLTRLTTGFIQVNGGGHASLLTQNG